MNGVAQKRSLRRQIYLSYLGIAVIGLIIFAVATFVTSQLKESSANLANKDIPLTIALLNTQVGLNRALASLRGWVALQHSSLREENNRAWDDDIWPAISHLEDIMREEPNSPVRQSLTALKKQLIDLKEWHWYIAEAAASDGNLSAQLHFELFVIPIYQDIIALLVNLVGLNDTLSTANRQSLDNVALVGMLKTLAEAQSQLVLFTLHGNPDSRQKFNTAQTVLTQDLRKIKNNIENSTEEQTDLVDELEKQVNGYRVLVEQVFTLRNDKSWNLANSWLENHALPLARSIHQNLENILATESSNMQADVANVVGIGEKSNWIFILLLVILVSSALLLARYWTTKLMRPIQTLVKASNELAKGNLAYSINTDGDDEISELARSFDSMRLALNKREQQLVSSETRLRTTIATVVDAIIVIDHKGIIQSVNPAACRLFLYQEEEMLGQNIKLLMPEPYKGEHDGYLDNYRKTNVSKIIGIGREVTGLRSDNSEFPVALAVSEMDINEQQQYVGLVRDITEQKKVDKMKSEFISVVSHELRTPLTSIRGSLGLLNAGAAGEINEKSKQMLDIAVRNTDRLIRLINEFLDIEKIESGKIELKKQIITVTDFLRQVITDNEGMATSHDVTLMLEDSGQTMRVEADIDRLNQVVTNLISNAIKYSPTGGTVSIYANSTDDQVTINVADTGPGIPPEFIPKIFQKFNQADSSTTREKGGTGLGLNIAKALVEQHGGAIGFETETGKGSRFYFDLPKWQEAEVVSPPATVRASGNRILICEDEADIANLIEMMLRQDGFETDIARSAEEAEVLLSQASYDAMTLDLGLPDKDGITLLQELRNKPETRDLPIIVVSATAEQGERQMNGAALGVVDWMDKPIDKDRLYRNLIGALPSFGDVKPRILHVEDDQDILDVVNSVVGNLAKMKTAKTLSRARSILQKEEFDLVILDLGLPDGAGEELMPLLNREGAKSTPVIVFSAKDISAHAIENIRATLIKSRTTNETLLQTIRAIIETRPGA